MVVDDSNFMRKATARILSDHPQIEVVSLMSSGENALTNLEKVSPDVILLDYHLGGMDGLETLKEIMKKKATPVIMFSGHTKKGADVTLKALLLGAFDFVGKPHGSLSIDLSSVKNELIDKILASSLWRPERAKKRAPHEAPHPGYRIRKLTDPEDSILIIASSTGGVHALTQIIPKLPFDFSIPVLVVQHMPPLFTRSFANSLDVQSALTVKEAEEGEMLRPGVVYIAPGGWQTKLTRETGSIRIKLDKSDVGNRLKPCADVTMNSVAAVYGKNSVAVILTGMGDDGTMGAGMMKDKGAVILAQDEASSSIFGMPRSVIEAGYADAVIGLDEMVDHLVSLR